MENPNVTAALIAGVVALVTAVVSAIITVFLAERRLRRELQMEFAAERVVHELLSRGWPLRSFKVLQHHLRGMEDDELRRLLIRSGAIAFTSKQGVEAWGLLDKNKSKLSTREELEAKGREFEEINGVRLD